MIAIAKEAGDCVGRFDLHWFFTELVIGLQSAGLAAAYFPEA